MSVSLPSIATLQYAAKLGIINDKPILFDYYVESLKGGVCFGKINNSEKILVKSNCQEYTSPIKNVSAVDSKGQSGGGQSCYIVETENSIYITASNLTLKTISK